MELSGVDFGVLFEIIFLELNIIIVLFKLSKL